MSIDWASSSLPVEILLGRLSTIALQIQQCRELGEIIQNAIEAARELTHTDRVIIYRFLPNGDGVVAFESTGIDAHPILGQLIYDPCLNAQWVERYQQGQPTAIADIHTGHISDCYIEFLDRIQVRANLVVPILNQGKLWGLLIAHHCHSPRDWQPLDIQVLQHIAIQLGIAIQQAALHQHDLHQPNPHQSHLDPHTLPQNYLHPAPHKATTPFNPAQAANLVPLIDTELYKSKILLAEAQRVARIGNWEYDLATRKNIWTEELFHLFNRDPASGEPPYQEQYRLYHPDDWAPLQAAMANALALGKPYHLVLRVPQIDGSLRYLEAIGQADQDEQGQVIRLYGTVQDITERKQAEIALQRSEEQRRFILDATQVGLWDWNMLTGELIWTENTFGLLGYAPEEVIPTQAAWRDRVHPDDLPILDQALQRDMTSPTGGEVEYRVIFPDGSVHWLLGKGRVIFNEWGDPIRMVGSLLDISDRKATEMALQQSESRFQRIVDSNIFGVILYTPTGEILETNDAFLQMLGYTQADWLAGQLRWDTITPPDYRAIDTTALEHLLTHGWIRPIEKAY
ncbi:MAG TPA: PAS domain-containing protein, partial [Allocoleopsis sp.]